MKLIGFYTSIFGTQPLFKEEIVRETKDSYIFKECGWITLKKNEIFKKQSESAQFFIDKYKNDEHFSHCIECLKKHVVIYKEFEKQSEELIALLKKCKDHLSIKHAVELKKEHNFNQLSLANIRFIVRDIKSRRKKVA